MSLTQRQKIGLAMQSWHSSSGDPIYAVGSFYYAGQKYPQREVLVDALSSIESLIPRADAGQHGWTKRDGNQLRRIASFIKRDLSETKPGHASGKLPTFRETRGRVFAALASRGWKQTGASSLKIPHWTSPDGTVRLWFKPQAVWYTVVDSPSIRHDFKDARSTGFSDLRDFHPDRIGRLIEIWENKGKRARHTSGLSRGRSKKPGHAHGRRVSYETWVGEVDRALVARGLRSGIDNVSKTWLRTHYADGQTSAVDVARVIMRTRELMSSPGVNQSGIVHRHAIKGHSNGQQVAEKDRHKVIMAVYKATNVSDKMLRNKQHKVMLVGDRAKRFGVGNYTTVTLEEMSNAELLRLAEAYNMFKSQRVGRTGGKVGCGCSK